jgi:hypothetical protein
MCSSFSSSDINLDSSIPTGPWTLYFHSPEETKWTLNTFINLGSMKTWRDFWSVIDSLNQVSLADGMFFMMRDPYLPLWENHQHIRGGCYSFRCQKKDASDIYVDYIIAAMLNSLTDNTENKINGLSISPKRGFNIIKLWNSDAQKFNIPSNLTKNISQFIHENDIIYTPFIQKKM